MWSTRTIIAFAWSCASVAACGGGGDPAVDAAPEPAFAADYAATFQEVRDCRRSPDHDLAFIRVLASPAAFEPYSARLAPFPQGAVVLKEEYADDQCTDLLGYTVMRKEAPGYAPAAGDWSWQRVSSAREVVTADEPRCIACHVLCEPPGGYDLTCAEP